MSAIIALDYNFTEIVLSYCNTELFCTSLNDLLNVDYSNSVACSLVQGRRQLLRSGGGLNVYRAAGSNLRMVRPSSMSVVKLLIIHARGARGKILDLAIAI